MIKLGFNAYKVQHWEKQNNIVCFGKLYNEDLRKILCFAIGIHNLVL